MPLLSKTFRHGALALALASTLLSPLPAQAQVPVIDNLSLAQIGQIVATTSQQLTQLQQMVSMALAVKNAIGAVGTGNLGAIAGWAESFGTGSPMNMLLGSFAPDVSELSSIATTMMGTGAQATAMANQFQSLSSSNFSNFNTTKSAVQNLFYASSGSGITAQDQVMAARTMAGRQAAQDGYAMSLSARAQSSQVTQQGVLLEQYTNAATTLRGDIQVNSMIEIAN